MSFSIVSGDNSTGPFGLGSGEGFASANSILFPPISHAVGTLVPLNATIASLPVGMTCFISISGAGTFNVLLPGTLPQNTFATIAFTDRSSVVETYATSTAFYSTTAHPGFTLWSWTALLNFPFNNGTTYAMTVTGENFPVPSVIGSVLAAAALTITTAGFVLGSVSMAYSPTIPAGEIISETPSAGTTGVAVGAPINVVISQGPQPQIPLQNTIPSYLYVQYADDDNLQAFVQSYNQMTQAYVTWFDTIGLPFYPGLTGDLLTWVVLGLYGLPRNALQSSSSAALGMLNTENLNYTQGPGTLNSYIPSSSTYYSLTDDVLKRILTWDFYKGDGKRFCMRWLKRRIMRFLVGVNGIDPQPTNAVVGAENTSAISAQVSAGVLTVQISQSTISALVALTPGILQVFQEAFQGGALDLPAQYTSFVCNIVA